MNSSLTINWTFSVSQKPGKNPWNISHLTKPPHPDTHTWTNHGPRAEEGVLLPSIIKTSNPAHSPSLSPHHLNTCHLNCLDLNLSSFQSSTAPQNLTHHSYLTSQNSSPHCPQSHHPFYSLATSIFTSTPPTVKMQRISWTFFTVSASPSTSTSPPTTADTSWT